MWGSAPFLHRCPRRDDLTVGAERLDLFAVPVFLLIFTIATAVILRGPIQVRRGSLLERALTPQSTVGLPTPALTQYI